jgi:hypothetical protein
LAANRKSQKRLNFQTCVNQSLAKSMYVWNHTNVSDISDISVDANSIPALLGALNPPHVGVFELWAPEQPRVIASILGILWFGGSDSAKDTSRDMARGGCNEEMRSKIYPSGIRMIPADRGPHF